MRQLVFLIVLIPSLAQATGLVNRYQYLNSRTLPQGVWTFAFNRGQSLSRGEGSFGSGGQRLSNQDFFSRDISYGHLLDEINDPVERELAGAAFSAYERQGTENAGRVINDVNVDQKSDTYVIGRGLTEKASLLIIFPIVTIRTSFNTRFVNSDSMNRFTSQLRSEGQNQRADEIVQKSQSALRERLSENGYRTSYPTEFTTLANIFIDYRYQAVAKKKFDLATDTIAVVPAGEKSDEDDFIYLRVNEEQYSLRQAITAGYHPSYKVSLFGSTYYHKRFAFEKERRIPVNEISPLSQDIDKNTRVQYGDTLGASLQANYIASETFTFYVGRSQEVKQRDQYSGSQYASERYNYLEKGTSQQLSLNYAGVAINTIRSFLDQKFPIPVDLNLQYSVASSGQNAFSNEAVALQMMVFYK